MAPNEIKPKGIELPEFLKIVARKVGENMKPLIQAEKTGKYEFIIEVNLTQGGIGGSFIECRTKERLKDEPN